MSEQYPMASLPIGAHSLLAHQIKYLEANSLFNIFVVVNTDNYKIVKSNLTQQFEADPRTSLTLVILQQNNQEESIESSSVLKAMENFNIPAYHDNEEVLIMEGFALLDPKNYFLGDIINDHYLTESSLTQVVQEVDPKMKAPVAIDDDSHEIYCYCENQKQKFGGSQLKRMVMKTDSQVTNNIQVNFKRSLLQNC